MIWLLIPIIIWIIALVIMGLPKFVYRKIQKLKVELKIDSKLAKHTNPDESMYKSMEEGILEIGSIFKTYASLAQSLVYY